MAEVKRIPQWVMVEALRNNVTFLHLEKSDGTTTGQVGVASEDFAIDSTGGDPRLELSIPQTLTVGVGDTITAILLYIGGANIPAEYDADDQAIRYPIVDVDGNGETFPDGGSIDTTEFEVYLNDL